jgi:hypothetical protein
LDVPDVSWRGSVGGPQLRSLRLQDASLAPEAASPASLERLERLQLRACYAPRSLAAVLHALPALTSLELSELCGYHAGNGDAGNEAEEGLSEEEDSQLDWLLALVAGCSQLRRLELHSFDLLDAPLPAGALTHLSYLSITEHFRGRGSIEIPRPWCSLPALRSLRLGE